MTQVSFSPKCGQCEAFNLRSGFCAKFTITEWRPDGTKLTAYSDRKPSDHACDRYQEAVPF